MRMKLTISEVMEIDMANDGDKVAFMIVMKAQGQDKPEKTTLALLSQQQAKLIGLFLSSAPK